MAIWSAAKSRPRDDVFIPMVQAPDANGISPKINIHAYVRQEVAGPGAISATLQIKVDIKDQRRYQHDTIVHPRRRDKYKQSSW